MAAMLTALDETSGGTLWTWGASLSGPMIITKNMALVSDGSHTYAVNLKSHQSVWAYNKGGSLALSENMLYIGSADNTLTALNAPLGPPPFVWNNGVGGSWATASNWAPSGPAAGMDYTADFSKQTLTGSPHVTLDGNQTIGNLIFGDVGNSRGWQIDTGAGGSLTLTVTSGSPEINVSNQTAQINASLAGTQGFTKTGNGVLTLTGVNTYTGATTVTAGTLAAIADYNLNAAQIVIGAATFDVSGNFNSARNLTLNSDQTTIAVEDQRTYTAATGAIVSGTGSLTKTLTGTLDLSNASTLWSGSACTGLWRCAESWQPAEHLLGLRQFCHALCRQHRQQCAAYC